MKNIILYKYKYIYETCSYLGLQTVIKRQMYCCFLLCLPLTVGSPFSFFSSHYFLTWAPTTTLLFLFFPQIKVVGKSCVFLQQLENKILFIKAKLYVLLQKLENKIYFIKASAFSPPPLRYSQHEEISLCQGARAHETNSLS